MCESYSLRLLKLFLNPVTLKAFSSQPWRSSGAGLAGCNTYQILLVMGNTAWTSHLLQPGKSSSGGIGISTQPQNLLPTACPAYKVFWDCSLAKFSATRLERLHAVTDGSKHRTPQPNMTAVILGRAWGVLRRRGEKGQRKYRSHGHHENTGPQNQLIATHGGIQRSRGRGMT